MSSKIEFNRRAVRAGEAVSEGMAFPGFNYWLFFGIGLIAWLILFALNFIPLLSIILVPILSGPLIVGIYIVILRSYDGEPVDFGMMFSGFNKFLPAMIIGLIQASPWIILQTIQLFANFAIMFAELFGGGRNSYQADPVPDFSNIFSGTIVIILLGVVFFSLIVAFVMYITFFCAYILLADHDLNAIDAVVLSAKAGWANAGGLTILAIYQLLIAFAGALLCGIGVFFVLPIIYGSTAAAYRKIFPKINPGFQTYSPPPPNEYGDMFGRSA